MRGHLALKGKSSITRLQEQDFFALPEILERLERYAWRMMGSKTVGAHGFLRLRTRDVFVHPNLQGKEVMLYETVDGLQAESDDGRMFLLLKYREQLCRATYRMMDADHLRLSFTRIYRSRRYEHSTEMLSNAVPEIRISGHVSINGNRMRNTVALSH